MLNWSEILPIALGSGVIGAVAKAGVDMYRAKSDSRRTDFELIVDNLHQEINSLKDEREKLIHEVERLQDRLMIQDRKINSLSTKFTLLESAHDNSPIPKWLKDTDGTMLAFNQAYIKIFLEPNGIDPQDYLMHFDHDVWPENISDEYHKNDQMVLRTKKTFTGTETAVIAGEKTEINVVKYCRITGGVVVGIAGEATPENWTTLKTWIKK